MNSLILNNTLRLPGSHLINWFAQHNNMLNYIKKCFRILGVNGLLCAIKAKLKNTEIYCTVDKFDCKHPFKLRIPSTDLATTKQIFINLEYDFSVKVPPKVIVDAGANIGLAAIYFANKYPDAKIIAIEPEQNNFALLKKNIAPYPNVIPIFAALWNENTTINLIDPGIGSWGFRTESKNHSKKTHSKNCGQVIAMTVDKIIKDYNLEKIDILKIDIEGAEKEVFSDTSSWLSDVNAIVIELHESLKPGCNRSFYCGSNGFYKEWRQGENIYMSRGDSITMKSY